MKSLFVLILLLTLSCREEQRQQPKPHQFPKIEFPQRSYVLYENQDCPFLIEIPVYSKVVKKELLFEDVKAEPCWFDIDISIFNATIHCSYYAIGPEHTFDKLVNDAFTMASKHNVKASFREEFLIKNNHNASGLIFKINGPVASPYQFYLTDSTHHFLRGSLYFNNKVNLDSVSPVIDFVEIDVERILNSLEWK